MSDIMKRHESLVFYIKFLEKQLQHLESKNLTKSIAAPEAH